MHTQYPYRIASGRAIPQSRPTSTLIHRKRQKREKEALHRSAEIARDPGAKKLPQKRVHCIGNMSVRLLLHPDHNARIDLRDTELLYLIVRY